ncbi:MAG: NAD-dependent protein deacetylase of SIR2 family [Deltaproteobacteria bacterium]|nr:NAD-dependent protein deacetylase of SIR2 family [Deltaproteobacteria bacterium]
MGLLKKDILKCCERLRNADKVLIGAGAGLSADAGLDYMDQDSFAKRFPALVKRGFRMKAELIGYTGWSPELMWGYTAVHVHDVRFQAPPHPVYGRLLDLVSDKDYFVITSNVDGMFFKNGFTEGRVFTPQGDYARMQCQTPCSKDTWPTKPIIDRILPTVDPVTQEVTDPDVIPHCPHCGGPAFMNVRGGDWFIEDPYVAQAERFTEWVRGTRDSRLLVIEIGAGFNTPVIVRWPMERIVQNHPEADLVRVNLHHPQVPREIVKKSIPLQCSAMHAVTAVWKAMGMNRQT